MRQRTVTAVSGVLVDGTHEVTDEMVIDDDPETVFHEVTQEVAIDLYAMGCERTIRAYRRQLISRIAMWPKTLAEIEAEVTKEVLG